jgi:hypothetical protein
MFAESASGLRPRSQRIALVFYGRCNRVGRDLLQGFIEGLAWKL